jgi:ABC-type transport system involved in cytochrome bd biosynthesis fused ATPase/permease subunit
MDALASLRRLSSTYGIEPLARSSTLVIPDQRSALLVKSATFEWEPVDESASPVFNDEQQGRETARAPFALSIVDLEVSRGSLVAVIGAVASGKSSLLQGLVGAMRRTSGEVSFCGRVGYCQQDAWIQRGSIVSRHPHAFFTNNPPNECAAR